MVVIPTKLMVIIPTKDSTYQEITALSGVPTTKTTPPTSMESLVDGQGQDHLPPAKRLKGATGEPDSSPSGSPTSPAEAPGQHDSKPGEPHAAQPRRPKLFGGLTQRQAWDPQMVYEMLGNTTTPIYW